MMQQDSAHPDHQDPTHVVTNFLLKTEDETDVVLLVRRSERVRTYRGAWAGISGYIEPGVGPLDQAKTEIREETGLDPGADVTLVREGQPLAVEDAEAGLSWVVHPFLWRVQAPERLKTDWEAIEMRWVPPEAMHSLVTVPRLADAFAAVYAPRAGA